MATRKHDISPSRAIEAIKAAAVARALSHDAGPLLVLAGSFDQFARFVKEQGFSPETCARYVSRLRDLDGTRGGRLVVCSSAEDRPDYDEIMREARARGFSVKTDW